MSSNSCYSWLEKINNIITITASATAKIKATFKTRGSSVAFIKISEEPAYRGDGIWEITTSFGKGEYIVKIEVIDGDIKVELNSLLKVYTAEEFSTVAGFEAMNNQIAQLTKALDSLKAVVTVSKNFKTAG